MIGIIILIIININIKIIIISLKINNGFKLIRLILLFKFNGFEDFFVILLLYFFLPIINKIKFLNNKY